MNPRDRIARLLARLRGWLGSGDGGDDGEGDDRGSDDTLEGSDTRRDNGDRAASSDGMVLVYASDERTETARELDDIAERAREESDSDRDDRH